MSKRFKGQTCAYCGEPGASSTGDHVIPRRFLPERLRANLPQVPACAACNNAKSIDEHYLATVLPFGGHHPEASAMLDRDVPRRLERNRKLHQALADGRTDIRLNQDGVIEETFALPVEADRLARFARWVIQGMHAHHWGPIPPDMWVGAGMLSAEGTKFHNAMMHLNGRRLRGDVGRGLFSYAALRSFEPPYISAWWLRLFGGVLMGGDPRAPDYYSRDLWGLVTTKPHPEMFGE